MINEKFRQILEIRDENNEFIGGRCIGDILIRLLENPTLENFFSYHQIRFNDFVDSGESSLKVTEFISKNKKSDVVVGPLEFITYLVEDISDNVLKNVITEKVPDVCGPDVNPIIFFSENLARLINEFHNFNIIPYTRNMTFNIINDFTYTPIKGRDKELENLHVQLQTQLKPNVVLTGKGGVGKTAIVEEYALRHKEDLTIYELNTSEIVSLGKDAANALKSVVSTLSKLDGDNVLFIDEFHLLCKSENYIAEFLKPMLARYSGFRLIVATTTQEFMQFVEKDKALERRFFALPINELSGDVLVEVLEDWGTKLEGIRNISYDKEVLPFIIEKMRVERQKVSPDKEKDILDGGYAYAYVNGLDFVDKNIIANVMSSRLNIPKEQLLGTMKEKLLALSDNLKSSIIGQDKAIDNICKIIKSNQIRKRKNKPLAKFLFVGPTSVGKTELAKQIAKELFGDENKILIYDCASMKEGYSVSSLLGSPPGYVGSENGGRLINDIRQKPFSVIVFDEFEKAHKDIHDMMLSLLDEGIITDKNGRIADATNCVIIFTTNIGADEVDETDENGDSSVCGFNTEYCEESSEFVEKDIVKNRISEYLKAAKDSLRPEMLARIDEVIVFNKLDKNSVEIIAKNRLNDFIKYYEDEYDLLFEIDDTVIDFIRSLSRNNARRIADVISSKIGGPLCDALLEESIVEGQAVIIWVEDKKLKLSSLPKEEFNKHKENQNTDENI